MRKPITFDLDAFRSAEAETVARTFLQRVDEYLTALGRDVTDANRLAVLNSDADLVMVKTFFAREFTR